MLACMGFGFALFELPVHCLKMDTGTEPVGSQTGLAKECSSILEPYIKNHPGIC